MINHLLLLLLRLILLYLLSGFDLVLCFTSEGGEKLPTVHQQSRRIKWLVVPNANRLQILTNFCTWHKTPQSPPSGFLTKAKEQQGSWHHDRDMKSRRIQVDCGLQGSKNELADADFPYIFNMLPRAIVFLQFEVNILIEKVVLETNHSIDWCLFDIKNTSLR